MSDCETLGDCPDSRIEKLYDYLDGELSHKDLVEIKTHLESCAECAKEHDLECVIREVVKRSCTEKAPTSLKDNILERIGQLKTAGH
ncbi:mycothiol system anti-sigma-R factor [Arthrobacter sp. TMN-37]